jgi:hypothetical protein
MPQNEASVRVNHKIPKKPEGNTENSKSTLLMASQKERPEEIERGGGPHQAS